MPQRLQRLYRVGEQRKHRARRDRIEQIADVVVARDLCHPEQAMGITASRCHFQRSLEIQERRTLSEEDRECLHGGICHGLHHIITRAFIRKPLNG
jgi:hypothetical protein